MNFLPPYISVLFLLTTVATLWLLYKAAGNCRPLAVVAIAWLAIQGIIGYSGFYTNTDTMPPRFILLIGPPLLGIILLFILPAGRRVLDTMNITNCTWLHLVRLPVEIVLFCLYLHGQVPLLMTFEGRNFDIFSGLTAPLMVFLTYKNTKTSRVILLVWNFLCLALLINIVAIAVLSAPFKFQQMAFDQPNVAVLYFPYIWLPGFIVPAVLLCHLAAIRKLTTPQR